MALLPSRTVSHRLAMVDATSSALSPAKPAAIERPDPAARLTALVEAHYDFVWRTFRFLGIDATTAEVGAQQVMCVLARRIESVEPGAEKKFLFGTALRVAAVLRRGMRRHPESGADALAALVASTPSQEELVDERRARELLEKALQALPVELRIVFALYELEELTLPEIAETLGVPLGTATSRLRRAREQFQSIVRRMIAAQRARGG